MSQILVLRHTISSHITGRVTSQGTKLAQIIGREIPIKFPEVITSSKKRAQITACLLGYPRYRVDERADEIDCPNVPPDSADYLRQIFRRRPIDTHFLASEFISMLSEIKSEAALVISHGTIMTAVLAKLCGMDLTKDYWQLFTFGNLKGFWVEVTDGRISKVIIAKLSKDL